MVDFHNYINAAVLIINGNTPYGNLEFFAPPWTALLFIPFIVVSPPYNMWLWQFGSILAIVPGTMLATRNRIYLLITIIAPPTLLTLAVGQVSAFVMLACIGLLYEVSEKRRIWIILICLLIASSKPHLVAIPTLIALMTLARQKEYRILLIIFAAFSILTIIFELHTPGIFAAWLRAMFSGSYAYGEPMPLQATLSNGTTIQIGISYYRAIPLLLSLPLGIWFMYLWQKEGLTLRVIAVSSCISFLYLPYYRLYDLVMLYYPIGIIMSQLDINPLKLRPSLL